MKNIFFLSAGITLLMGSNFLLTPSVKALTITSNSGKEYNLSVLTADYGDPGIEAKLQQQDWWEDESLAAELAEKVKLDLGSWSPHTDIYPHTLSQGVSFVWTQGVQVNGEFGTRGRFWDEDLNEVSYLYACRTCRVNYAVEVPTPTVILPSLIGMGFFANGKQKKTSSIGVNPN